MDIPSILDPRRGLETRLRKAWEEFFELSKFILDNREEVNLNLGKVLDSVCIRNPSEVLNDPRYAKYFKEAYESENPCISCLQYIDVMEDEFGQLDWSVPICKEAWLWLWFITYTATLTRIDALYITPTLIKKKDKNQLKSYFYLKWIAVLYGENRRKDRFKVIKLSSDGKPLDKTPRKWEIDRKTLSLGYIRLNIPEEVKKKIKSTQDLSSYLENNPPEIFLKAQVLRETFYLFKNRFKEIQILERLFPVLRKKKKNLPYEEWFHSFSLYTLGRDIITLKRLLDYRDDWFEFWEDLC